MDRPLTDALREDGAPLDLDGYERAGGYRSLRKALHEMQPADVTAMVKASNLRGRGGGGFPTGIKWQAVPMGPSARRPKYLVCNADEMEPGTFKDRLLLEGNPHLLLEGMMLAAYAIEAEVAYVFVRWAYKRAEETMRAAVEEAYERGYLGQHILGSPFSLELHLHTSAGRYICGEETAHLDVEMDFGSVVKVGSRMGTGTMIILDDKTCPVGMVLNLERFFARESGALRKCARGTPLRIPSWRSRRCVSTPTTSEL